MQHHVRRYPLVFVIDAGRADQRRIRHANPTKKSKGFDIFFAKKQIIKSTFLGYGPDMLDQFLLILIFHSVLIN